MANKKKNKLDFNTIKKTSAKQFTTKKIEILVDDKNYSIAIDQVFRTTKIEKMIMKFVNSENINHFSACDESVKLSYYFYLIIKEFTDLEIPDDLKFNEEINLISSLIDLDIFEQIMKEVPKTEIKKVNDFMAKFNVNLNKIINEDDMVDEDLIGDINLNSLDDKELSDKIEE